MSFWASILGIFLLSCLGATHVAAEATDLFLEISPAGVQTEMVGGDKKTIEITVKNIGAMAAAIRVYAKPYNVNSDDYSIDLETENIHSQIYKWIEFSETEFSLEAGAEKTLQYTITVPENAITGGQYAAIFAETTGKKLEEGSSGLSTTIRTTSLLYVRIANEEVRQVRVEFDLPIINIGTKIFGTGTVFNEGNIDAQTEYRFEIRPLFSDQTLYATSQRHTVLPGIDEEGHAETFEWGDTPFFGIFRAKYILSLPWEEKTIEKLVIVMPWPFAIMFCVIVALAIVWIVLVVRKRRRRLTHRGNWRH
jgi:hypothetical protein